MAEREAHKQLMTDDLILSIFVAVEGAHAFSAFMPSTFTTMKFGGNDGDAQMLRMGYIPSIIFNLILGGTVSYFAKSKKPLIASILVITGMVGFYEWNIMQGSNKGFNISKGQGAVGTSNVGRVSATDQEYSQGAAYNVGGQGPFSQMGWQADPAQLVAGDIAEYTGEMGEGSGGTNIFQFLTGKSAAVSQAGVEGDTSRNQ